MRFENMTSVSHLDNANGKTAGSKVRPTESFGILFDSLDMLKRILVFIGYVCLGLLLAAGTFLLVAYGNDYAYDFQTHKIIQNGHVILASVPNSIKVTADGKLLTKKTPYQAAYSVGVHTFSLSLPGYWTWSKAISIMAGQVSLARYIILVPKDPTTRVLDSQPAVTAQSISKDHRHLAYVTGGATPALYTLDLGSQKLAKIYTPPAAAATTPAEVIESIGWSDDASHLLMVTSNGQGLSYKLLAADGSSVIDLTNQFHTDLTGLSFSTTDWRVMYFLAPDGLRKIDMGSGTVSGPIASGVSQFWPEPGGRVLYVQKNANGDESLNSVDSNNNRQEVIEALPVSPTYDVAYSTYNGQNDLAVVPAATQTGTLYTGIFGSNPVATKVATGVTGASFAPDGHLLVFSGASQMITYDLEQSSVYQKFVAYPSINQPGTLEALSWFDNYHLLSNRSGILYWSDFDGTNRVELGPIDSIFPAYGSSDMKSLIAFRPEKTSVSVTVEQIVK
jgi:PEGA domain